MQNAEIGRNTAFAHTETKAEKGAQSDTSVVKNAMMAENQA